jgi:hypothetical protein
MKRDEKDDHEADKEHEHEAATKKEKAETGTSKRATQ